MKRRKKMSSDKWARKWTVNFANPKPLADVITPAPGPTQIELKPIDVDDKVIGYRVVKVAGHPLPPSLKDCTLFLRGSKAIPKPNIPGGPTLPLNAWVPPPANGTVTPLMAEYTTVANAVAATGKLASSERLEGDMHVGGVAESVTLMQIPGAIKNGSAQKIPMLVIDVRADPASPVPGHQSGIGHGN
jgi:hypothetical protein